MNKTVYIFVQGGVVTGVTSNDHTLDIILVDYDMLSKEDQILAEEKINSLHEDFIDLHIDSI